jgi:hypothetical protein
MPRAPAATPSGSFDRTTRRARPRTTFESGWASARAISFTRTTTSSVKRQMSLPRSSPGRNPKESASADRITKRSPTRSPTASRSSSRSRSRTAPDPGRPRDTGPVGKRRDRAGVARVFAPVGDRDECFRGLVRGVDGRGNLFAGGRQIRSSSVSRATRASPSGGGERASSSDLVSGSSRDPAHRYASHRTATPEARRRTECRAVGSLRLRPFAPRCGRLGFVRNRAVRRSPVSSPIIHHRFSRF